MACAISREQARSHAGSERAVSRRRDEAASSRASVRRILCGSVPFVDLDLYCAIASRTSGMMERRPNGDAVVHRLRPCVSA